MPQSGPGAHHVPLPRPGLNGVVVEETPFRPLKGQYLLKIDMSQRLAAYRLYINHDILNVEINLT